MIVGRASRSPRRRCPGCEAPTVDPQRRRIARGPKALAGPPLSRSPMTVVHPSPPLPARTLDAAVGALRAGGLRVSAARRLVLGALYAADGPVSAEGIAGGLEGRLPAQRSRVRLPQPRDARAARPRPPRPPRPRAGPVRARGRRRARVPVVRALRGSPRRPPGGPRRRARRAARAFGWEAALHPLPASSAPARRAPERGAVEMFGLDESIAALGTGDVFLVVAGVAVLLGLRHATDPDHLTAVSTLIAGDEGRSPRDAGRLGLRLGHRATRPRCSCSGCRSCSSTPTCPRRSRRGAEAAVGVLIMALRARGCWCAGGEASCTPTTRARRGPRARTRASGLRHRARPRDGRVGGSRRAAARGDPRPRRRRRGAAAVRRSSPPCRWRSPRPRSGGRCRAGRCCARFVSVAPALGALSLAFGAWYSLGALNAVPYYF